MLINGERLISAPVLSLQTGGELARTVLPVMNPANLEIPAYEIGGPLLQQKPSLLRIDDIREISDIGLIVDSSDEFVTTGDIIKLDEIYSLGFNPIGMKVTDEKHHNLGKVNGYVINTINFLVEQLSIKRPFFKSFNDTQLLVHRSQIIEINDDAIIIHSEAEIPEPILDTVKNSYVNPFRKSPVPEQPENAG